MTISAGTFTVGGAGTSYPGVSGLNDCVAAMAATLTGNFTIDVKDNVNFTTGIHVNLAGYTLTLTSSLNYHNGNPLVGSIVTLTNNCEIGNTNNDPSLIVIEKLQFKNNRLTAGADSNGSMTVTAIQVFYCIFNGCYLWSNVKGHTSLVCKFCFNKFSDDFKLFNHSWNAQSAVIVENNSSIDFIAFSPVYGQPSANWTDTVIRNNHFSFYDCNHLSSPKPTAYNNSANNSTAKTVAWANGDVDNIENTVNADEFKSVDITNADFLELKDEAVGDLSTLGIAPTSASVDIAGNPIPYSGNYFIGAHGSHVTPDPEFLDMIIDSGMVYKDYGLETETIIGATRGGNKFWIEQGIEDIGYDGRGANVKGAKKILRVQPFIEVNVIEISQDLLLSALPASVVASGATQVTITRALQISLSDYCDNITIVGEIYGNNLPIICMVKNALCVSDLNMEYTDKSETVLTLKFAGHFDEDNLNEEPWEIRYPREA